MNILRQNLTEKLKCKLTILSFFAGAVSADVCWSHWLQRRWRSLWENGLQEGVAHDQKNISLCVRITFQTKYCLVAPLLKSCIRSWISLWKSVIHGCNKSVQMHRNYNLDQCSPCNFIKLTCNLQPTNHLTFCHSWFIHFFGP